jgi:uracil-DNA glycosylase
MKTDIEAQAKRIVVDLLRDEKLGEYINPSLDLPKAYRGEGSGEIKLVILGQDPTIQIIGDRQKITIVLNLDKSRSVRGYLKGVCMCLGIDLDHNVYATNLFKNFFRAQPMKMREIKILDRCFSAWLDLLKQELAEFEGNVPVLTLGQPVLKLLLRKKTEHPLREHWGYMEKWQTANIFGEMRYVNPEDNYLDHALFPFPHVRTWNRGFYHARKNNYVEFVKARAFLR